jgi:hypothetical protein
LLQIYPLRNFAFGFGHRGVRIPFQAPFEALEQAKVSKSGGELRKGRLAIIPFTIRLRKSEHFIVNYALK